MARPVHSSAVEAAGSSPLDEVSCLQADIARVEAAIQKQQERNKLLLAWQNYQEQNAASRRESSALAKTVQNEIQILQDLFGISISSVKSDIKEQDALSTVIRMHVEGHCETANFAMDMDVKEQMNSDLSVETTISNITVLMPEDIYEELGHPITVVTENCNIQGYFMMLKSYCKWQSAREQTFTFFTDMYPDIVEQKGSDTLLLKHPSRKCSLEMKWTHVVLDLCFVTPDLQLFVLKPAIVKDTDGILQRTPQTFHLMLKELGIERTLHTLIQLMKE